MNCLDWEERIALHAGGDLVGEEAAEVERHVGDCAACQVFWSGLRETLGELRDVHAEGPEPAHFVTVRAGVMAEIERGRRIWRRLAWVSGVGIAAAVMVAVLVRPGPLPKLPAPVAMSIPPAEVARPVARSMPPGRRRQPALAAPHSSKEREAVMVKYQTADPDIVIYWIGENE